MSMDLTVSSGTTLTLDTNPPDNLKNSFERIQISKLEDLVTAGFVQSTDKLDHLLDSAKIATTHALSLRNEPLPAITGVHRVDLRRFGNFILSNQNATFHEQKVFWNIFREIPPHSAINIDVQTKLGELVNTNLRHLNLYRFLDITVESKATLEFTKEVNTCLCNNLVIKNTGRIVVQRGSLHINATSIEGEQ
ncbi:hypothetical protein ACSFXN_18260 [Planococcus sp. 1R117A]|uniref:hypothetical protein n=1 Tax=Planococcus sp. 1R117A TaxID=3447020 RepID=UPI003EDC716A